MVNKKSTKEVMKEKSQVVNNIINKTINIESKYINRENERNSAVNELVEMIKNEVR